MQNEYKTVQKETVSENIFTECSEDFVLPDYMPEICRVLKLETSIIKGDGFLGSAKADFDGTVLYTLFYTDNEETLTAVPLESRYHYELPLGAVVPELVFSEERLDSVNMRPCGPRRVFIRSRIRACVHSITKEPLQKALDDILPSDVGEVERLEKKTQALYTTLCRCEPTEASTEFILEGRDSEKLRPVYAKSETVIDKITAEDGHLICRGALLLYVLLEDGGDTVTLTRKIPFEDASTADSRAGDAVLAKALPSAITVSLSQNGADAVITASAKHGFEALIERNEPVSLTKDAYATEKKLDLSMRSLTLRSLTDALSGTFTVDGELSLPEGTDVLLISLFPREASLSWQNKRAVLAGEMRAELLCFGREGSADEAHYYAKEHHLPFRIELEGKFDVLEGDEVRYELVPHTASVSMQNGKGRLASEVSVSLRAYRDEAHFVPEDVKGATPFSRESDELTVYYPTDKDSLWSVAKAFGVPLLKLREQNGIAAKEDVDTDDRQTLDGTAWLFASLI